MKRFLFLFATATTMLASSAPYAQNQAAFDRVERVEQRLMALENKLFAQEASPQSGSVASGPLMADFEARLQQLEEEARHVYGAVEELGHSVNQLAEKLQLLTTDYDMRLQDIEKALTERAAEEGRSTAVRTPQSNANKPTPALYDEMAEVIRKNSAATAGNKTASSVSKARESVSKVEAREKGTVTGKTPEDEFQQAYTLLNSASYDEAEKQFKAFTTQHPEHELASSAYYWLGEIYLVKKDPENAVVTFSTGLSKFPKGEKAPANLYKMGIAFKEMGKKDMARGSWQKLVKDYPNSKEASDAIKDLEKLG